MNVNDQVTEVGVKYLAEMATEIVPAGYKQTELGVIPEDWEVVFLSNVCKEIGDGMHATPIYSSSGGYCFINGNNILNGKVIFDENTKKIDETEFLKHQKKLSTKTILLSINGTIGNLAFFNNEPLILGKSIAYLTIKDRYSKVFIYYILQNSSTKRSFDDGLTGTTIRNLGLSIIRQTLIIIPQIAEQIAIANALSDVDALINELEKLITKKQAIKTATMQQLLTGRTRLPQFALREDGTKKGYKQSEVGEIPEDWDIKRLGDFTDCTAGGTPSTSIQSYWGGENPWMSSGELHLKRVYDVAERITQEGLANSSTKYIPENSVLMGLAGQGKTRGTVAISKISLCTNQSIAAIFPSENHSTDYLYYNLDQRYDELRGLSTGDGGRGGLNLTIIKSLLIPFLCIEEQTTIATILSDMDTEIQTLQQRLSKTCQIKQGMMQELLTGKTRLKIAQMDTA